LFIVLTDKNISSFNLTLKYYFFLYFSTLLTLWLIVLLVNIYLCGILKKKISSIIPKKILFSYYLSNKTKFCPHHRICQLRFCLPLPELNPHLYILKRSPVQLRHQNYNPIYLSLIYISKFSTDSMMLLTSSGLSPMWSCEEDIYHMCGDTNTLTSTHHTVTPIWVGNML
jgi:hypothetical protein